MIITGNSAAGKTTLLRIASGLTFPTSGLRAVAETELPGACVSRLAPPRCLAHYNPSMRHDVRFETVDHFVRIPVRVGQRECWFLFDSGIGLTVINPSLAESVGMTGITETFTGRRMSGQDVSAALVRMPEVSLGGFTIGDHVAGVVDMGTTESGSSFDGILGLDFFADERVTIDPANQQLTVGDCAPERGIVVPVEVRRDKGSVVMFAPLELPSGRVVTMEVDSGSGALILDDRYMPDCQVASNDRRIDELQGIDETGQSFTRRFITIDGSVQVPGEPLTTQRAPRVMFQQIIHDGLIGTEFLDRFCYSFDVPREQLVLAQIDLSGTS